MAIQTFTAAQVLTAAQMNSLQANDYNQTVATKTASYTLVAADKGTRVVMNVASANTVTVNTSLFSASDTLVIQNIGAGVTTVTAGTATVSSAGPLAIPQNGSGTLYFTSAGVSIFYPSAGPAASSGLTFITTTTFTDDVSINNCFSATYDNYKVVITKVVASSGAMSWRFRTSGTDNTNNNYSYGAGGVNTNTGAYSNLGSRRNEPNWRPLDNAVDTDGTSMSFDVLLPFASANSICAGSCAWDQEIIGVAFSTMVFNASTSFDGFSLFKTGGTLAGTVTVYGYQKS